MRVQIGQTTKLFHAEAVNYSLNRKRPEEERQGNMLINNDRVSLSSQGKSSSLLANLMKQKELIQMNKDALIKRTLGEDGTGAAGLQEKLEEYDEQMDSLDEQIAREMAKQSEPASEKGSIYDDPRKAERPELSEDKADELTEKESDAGLLQKKEEVQERREREKEELKSEIELGSEAAKSRLKKLERRESLMQQIEPILNRR